MPLWKTVGFEKISRTSTSSHKSVMKSAIDRINMQFTGIYKLIALCLYKISDLLLTQSRDFSPKMTLSGLDLDFGPSVFEGRWFLSDCRGLHMVMLLWINFCLFHIFLCLFHPDTFHKNLNRIVQTKVVFVKKWKESINCKSNCRIHDLLF